MARTGGSFLGDAANGPGLSSLFNEDAIPNRNGAKTRLVVRSAFCRYVVSPKQQSAPESSSQIEKAQGLNADY